MTYHRGTLSEFNAWHEQAKIAEGLPKIGYVDGVLTPQNQQTINYVDPIQNPSSADDCVWEFGAYPIEGKDVLSQENFEALGWGDGKDD